MELRATTKCRMTTSRKTEVDFITVTHPQPKRGSELAVDEKSKGRSQTMMMCR